MKAFLEEIRSQIKASHWDKGVYLARSDSVTCEQEGTQELLLRVLDKATDVCYRVQLWPQDLDWQCNCGGDDPCSHIAAAAIAWSTARRNNAKLPTADNAGAGLVHYAFSDRDGLLYLQRGVGTAEQFSSFTGNLRRNQGKLKFMADSYDWACDQILPPPWHGVFERLDLKRLFRVLHKVDRISFEGKPIRILENPPQYHALVQNDGKGVLVTGEFAPPVDRVFKNGACLTTSGIALYKPLDDGDKWITYLRAPRKFAASEMAHFMSDILPQLHRSIKVQNEASNLPQEIEEPVYIEIDLQREPSGLALMPRVVYGRPPLARVEGERLILLKKKSPRRRLDKERSRIQDLHRYLGLTAGIRQNMGTGSALKLLSRAAKYPDLFYTSGDAGRDFKVHTDLTPQISWQEGRLALQLYQGSSEQEGEPGEALAADPKGLAASLRSDEPLIPLLAGGFAEVPSDWFRKYGPKILEFLEAQSEAPDETLPKASWKDAAQMLADLGHGIPQPLTDFADKMATLDHTPGFARPQDFCAELRPYQTEGVGHLALLQTLQLGGLLADDMGLGKTVQTIALLKGISLVVAPTSVLFNWQNEIERFRPQMKVCVYYGPDRCLPQMAAADRPPDLTILTSYALLRMDIQKLKKVRWSNVILDEAHQIKNPRSLVTQAAYQLHADFKLALTGTPIENHLDDLYSQFRFLHPGFLGSYEFFREHYVQPIYKGDEMRAGALRERIKPFMLRRQKEDVLKDLPVKTEMNLYVELSEPEQQLYDSIFLASQKTIQEQLKGGKMMDALAALLRLRQAACHSRLIPGQAEAPLYSSKVETLVERLEQILDEGHKALVFSQWTSFLDLIGQALSEKQMDFLRLDGGTKDRSAIVQTFQDPKGPPLLIMSLKAGGVGLNLTAADHVFITDPWWNPAAEEQAADRAHRIGQDKPVMVYRLISKGTIEESMEKLKDLKRSLADNIVSTNHQSLSGQELLKLFQE